MRKEGWRQGKTQTCSSMVKFGKTPIDESKNFLGVINHHIVWFDVAVHNALRVTEIQSLSTQQLVRSCERKEMARKSEYLHQFVHIILDIFVGKSRV
jgi:hypothetical protein